jgi:hypothetical protein
MTRLWKIEGADATRPAPVREQASVTMIDLFEQKGARNGLILAAGLGVLSVAVVVVPWI